MMDEIQVQPSPSMEVLDLLVGAGLNRVQAANLLSGVTVPGQRHSMHGLHKDQRSSSPLVGGQSIPQTAAKPFKTMVMETLARFGEKLKYLTARSRAVTPLQQQHPARCHKRPAPEEMGQTVHWTSQQITWRRSHGHRQFGAPPGSGVRGHYKDDQDGLQGTNTNTANYRRGRATVFQTWRTQCVQSWTKW